MHAWTYARTYTHACMAIRTHTCTHLQAYPSAHLHLLYGAPKMPLTPAACCVRLTRQPAGAAQPRAPICCSVCMCVCLKLCVCERVRVRVCAYKQAHACIKEEKHAIYVHVSKRKSVLFMSMCPRGKVCYLCACVQEEKCAIYVHARNIMYRVYGYTCIYG